MITVANAPVSYGVFDLARPELVPLPCGGELLDAVAARERVTRSEVIRRALAQFTA